MLVLATCLGTVLLGMTVTEIGTPVLPWDEQRTPSPETQAVAEAATKTPEGGRSGSPSDTPSAAPSEVPVVESSEPVSASPSVEPSPTETSEPAPEPTEITGTVDPADPTPTEPPQETSEPPEEEDDDYDDCWLLFCS